MLAIFFIPYIPFQVSMLLQVSAGQMLNVEPFPLQLLSNFLRINCNLAPFNHNHI